jgi:hypothetical protein
MEFSTEELAAAACRGGTLFGSPRSDPVGIQFDWEVPSQARAPIVFEVRVRRGGRESSIRFAIDLDRLEKDALQTLHDFLAYPPKGYWLARTIAWLIDISLRQQHPHWSAEHRRRKVRELLLTSPQN